MESQNEIERLQRENLGLSAAANAIMDSLEWTGDGYEWNPKCGHYAERPRDAVARAAAGFRKRLETAEIDRDDLLAACKAAEAAIVNCVPVYPLRGDPLAQIRAAIAKASR